MIYRIILFFLALTLSAHADMIEARKYLMVGEVEKAFKEYKISAEGETFTANIL